MNKEIATISRTMEIVNQYDLMPKKGYGQNFIIEPEIVRKIAREAMLDKDTAVLEIGPGIGALTEQLLKIAGTVLAYEIDNKLWPVLEDTLSEYSNIDNLYANIDNITGKMKLFLQEQKDMAYISRQLATIKTDCEIDCRLNDFTYSVPFNKEVYNFFTKYQFNSLLKKKDLLAYILK